jgi:predicted dinucleotide-binding enzyme
MSIVIIGAGPNLGAAIARRWSSAYSPQSPR